jgi:hypothetical protein
MRPQSGSSSSLTASHPGSTPFSLRVGSTQMPLPGGAWSRPNRTRETTLDKTMEGRVKHLRHHLRRPKRPHRPPTVPTAVTPSRGHSRDSNPPVVRRVGSAISRSKPSREESAPLAGPLVGRQGKLLACGGPPLGAFPIAVQLFPTEFRAPSILFRLENISDILTVRTFVAPSHVWQAGTPRH